MQPQEIAKMSRHIQQNVDNFLKSRRSSNPVLGRDDLMQEGTLWFIETAKTKGVDLAYRNYLDLHHAMYEATRKSYPLSIACAAFPKRETIDFIPIDMCDLPTDSLEDIATDHLNAEQLYARLNAQEKRIVDMRLQGMTLNQIAKSMNVPMHTVSYIIKKMRDRLRPLKQPA